MKEKLLYMGKEYLIEELIKVNDIEEEVAEKLLKKFYITSCKKVIAERINIYQKQLRVKPKTIEVVESKKQWGSCNSKRELTINYRLVMAPIEIIDYVVVHELCHLLHMNHDRSFWRLVGSVLPDYKKRQEFLNLYGCAFTL